MTSTLSTLALASVALLGWTHRAPAAEARFHARTTAAEIAARSVLPIALLPARPPSDVETRALALALAAYEKEAAPQLDRSRVDLAPLERFLAAHPASPWTAALQANLGQEYYQRGFFTRALQAWRQAWEIGQSETEPARAAIADRALAELVRMLARLGRVEELGPLFAATRERSLQGAATEIYSAAYGGYSLMLTEPGESFKCGPWGLESVLRALDPKHPHLLRLKRVASTAQGTSLAELAELARELKLDYLAARRPAGAAIPVPAVVHWKLGHYGALIRHENGRYLLEDPTFGGSQWIAAAALEAEASGAFLVSARAARAARWTELSTTEAGGIWGRGNPISIDPPPPPLPPLNDSPDFPAGPVAPRGPRPSADPANGERDNDSRGDEDNDGDEDDRSKKDGGGGDEGGGGSGESEPCSEGMARWSVQLSTVSLQFRDTPVFYRPPFGPPMRFRLSYTQREVSQPTIFDYGNVGPKWSFNWISTLHFDSNNGYLSCGESGQLTFTGFPSTAPESNIEPQSSAKLVREAGGIVRLVLPDGRFLRFAQPTPSGRLLLTSMADRYGNVVTLGYTGQKLTTITDALGQVTTLLYENANPLLITRITDPFGRSAILTYHPDGRLASITDALGLVSSFRYAANDFIDQLTTPYGQTGFVSTESGLGRKLEITEADGSRQKVESPNGITPGIAKIDPVAQVPVGMPVFNDFLNYRNTLHWNRKAMAEAPNDVSRAVVYHYLHGNSLSKGHLLESRKRPLENRVWFYYQGQLNPGFINTDGVGMGAGASHIARVQSDGSTRLRRASFNALGYRTSRTDPLGRHVEYTYAANGRDLLEIRRSAPGLSPVTVSAFAGHNAAGQPATYTDASGQTTHFVWRPDGRPTSVTNPLGEVSLYSYNAAGYLTGLSGPAAGATASVTLTYDAAGRVATSTDAAGYTRSFGYDHLNRVRLLQFPDGTMSQFGYDRLDLQSVQDRRGRTVTYAYDSLRRLVSATDPAGRTVSQVPCRCGAPESYTDALGRTTRWEYDARGRRTARIGPDGARSEFTYDPANGALRSGLSPRGALVNFAYHPDGALRSVVALENGQTVSSVVYEYDRLFPRLTARLDARGRTVLSYHPFEGGLGAGRLASVQGPHEDFAYTYDPIGRVNTKQVAGEAQSFGYNERGLLDNLSNGLGAFTFAYLGGNTAQVSSVARPGGLSSLFDYENNLADRRLREILHRRADLSPVSQWNLTTLPGGRVETWTQRRATDPARLFTFGYDALDQLTSASATAPTEHWTYSYDEAGNRLTDVTAGVTRSYVVNPANELVSIDPAAMADRTYEWDYDDRLTAIVYTGTNRRTEIGYDSLGRWVSLVEKENGTVQSAQNFVWEGYVRRAERPADNGTVTRRFYTHGEKILTGPHAGSYAFLRDHLGNVREVVDAAGAVRARYDYDPFGRRTRTAGDLDFDRGFTGHFHHAPSGLVFAPLRMYDPRLGRWLSRDPIRERGGVNLYRYVGNNPVNQTDPLGLFAIQVGVGGGFTAALTGGGEVTYALVITTDNIDFGAVGTVEGGGAIGAGGSGFGTVTFSPWARCLQDLLGTDINASASGGVIGVLGGSLGFNSEGEFSSFGGTIGLGAEVEAGVTVSYTAALWQLF